MSLEIDSVVINHDISIIYKNIEHPFKLKIADK